MFIIDISTFTHEMLLILIRIIYNNKERFKKITCIYVGASEYSIGDPLEMKWLSKGCKDIRSVIGYPGRLIPGKPNCLIVLVGFEHERAINMINRMDPERILLGNGITRKDHIISESHLAPMLFFQKLLSDLLASRNGIDSFEFSSRDVITTIDSLQKQIELNVGYNNIIVPLNSKISTIAVALVAFKNPDIQVCYAEPVTYNYDSYSSPDDYMTIFDIDLNP